MVSQQLATEKIQKVLARAGLASRRTVEQWLSQARITVNGMPAKVGDRITLNDSVKVDNKLIVLRQTASQATRVLCYNKPLGEVCTRSDPKGRPTVFAALPPIDKQRWVMIGRLDVNTTGLLLFTNNGELANALMHPRCEIVREYAVRILGKVTPAMLERLQKGVKLKDGMAAFAKIEVRASHSNGVNQWYRVQLREGRNREVRRLWESQGVVVSRLLRTRYGPVTLTHDLNKGHVHELTPTEVKSLFRSCDLYLEDVRF